MAGKRLTHIHTECGHDYRTAWPACELAGSTTDCRICASLLIFPEDVAGTAVRAELFHAYMSRLDPDWPVDGSNTYWVSF
jgi:hypothetical protein